MLDSEVLHYVLPIATLFRNITQLFINKIKSKEKLSAVQDSREFLFRKTANFAFITISDKMYFFSSEMKIFNLQHLFIERKRGRNAD